MLPAIFFLPLTLDTTLPITLTIPSIDLVEKVVAVGFVDVEGGTSWAVPEDAVGWHQDSAKLGEGNTVLNGHSNAYDMVFRDLINLKTGSIVHVYSEAKTDFRFQVIEILRLKDKNVPMEQRQANVKYVLPTGDVRLTLVTCIDTEYRLVVIAKLVN